MAPWRMAFSSCAILDLPRLSRGLRDRLRVLAGRRVVQGPLRTLALASPWTRSREVARARGSQHHSVCARPLGEEKS
eukprot:9108611-Alexandrium_andersonii.AAC.1